MEAATVLNLDSSEELAPSGAVEMHVCVPAMGAEEMRKLEKRPHFPSLQLQLGFHFSRISTELSHGQGSPFFIRDSSCFSSKWASCLHFIGTNKVFFHLASSPFPWDFCLFILGLTSMGLRINWLLPVKLSVNVQIMAVLSLRPLLGCV